MSEEQQFTPREWTYIGRYTQASGKAGAKFLDEQGETQLFAQGKTNRRYQPGAVYRVEVRTDGQQARFPEAHAAYLRTHPDGAQVAAWRAEDRAFDLRKAAAKAADTEPLQAALKALEPLRKAYLRTSPSGRAALEVAVLNYLRQYRNREEN